MDRDQDYDVLDTTPTTTIKSTLFPTIQANNCPVSILPLTSVKAHQGTLISKVETMNPTGTTNVTIGLVWGWHALTSELAADRRHGAESRNRQGHHPA